MTKGGTGAAAEVMVTAPIGPLPILIAILAAMDGLWLSVIPQSGVTGWTVVMTCAVLAAVHWVYGRWRKRPNLANLAAVGWQMIAYTAVVALFSYCLAGLGRPLIDDALVSFDRGLGFDWLALRALLRDRPWMATAAQWVYGSLGLQLIVLQVALNGWGRISESRQLLWGFVATSLATILVSAVLPAGGAFLHYGVALDTPYLQQFLAARAGRLGVIDLAHVEGVVQFPSFHAALAVLLVHAVRRLPWLWPPVLLLNLMVLASTPFIGGHHLSDLLGGLAVAGLWLAFLHRQISRSS